MVKVKWFIEWLSEWHRSHQSGSMWTGWVGSTFFCWPLNPNANLAPWPSFPRVLVCSEFMQLKCTPMYTKDNMKTANHKVGYSPTNHKVGWRVTNAMRCRTQSLSGFALLLRGTAAIGDREWLVTNNHPRLNLWHCFAFALGYSCLEN